MSQFGESSTQAGESKGMATAEGVDDRCPMDAKGGIADMKK